MHLLEQTIVKGVEVGENDRIGLELRAVLGQRCGEVIKRAFLVSSSHSTHSFDIRPGKLDATLACDL